MKSLKTHGSAWAGDAGLLKRTCCCPLTLTAQSALDRVDECFLPVFAGHGGGQALGLRGRCGEGAAADEHCWARCHLVKHACMHQQTSSHLEEFASITLQLIDIHGCMWVSRTACRLDAARGVQTWPQPLQTVGRLDSRQLQMLWVKPCYCGAMLHAAAPWTTDRPAASER